MDSLNAFVVFVQVAETRSFVAAGRLLGISASAVGKSVARLEEKLGVPVKLVTGTSYTAVIEAMRAKRADGSWDCGPDEIAD